MSLLARQSGISEQMVALGAEWLPGERLSQHTSLGVGGPADIIRVHDARRLPELAAYLHRHGVPWRILGGGSNLLVADQGLPDVLLQLARGEAIAFAGNRAEVPAAANLGTAILECAKRNLGGMEGLIGVPGTVGGALRMNAGAYGTEIGDVAPKPAVESVMVLVAGSTELTSPPTPRCQAARSASCFCAMSALLMTNRRRGQEGFLIVRNVPSHQNAVADADVHAAVILVADFRSF